MRKLKVLTFVTMDGVMQAPGGPEEDPTGGFRHGGWVAPYLDDFFSRVVSEQMGKPFVLLLGRRTYEIFAAYWPYTKGHDELIATQLNKAKKYVASMTLQNVDWENSQLIKGDVGQFVRELKSQGGPEIQVHGSGNLIQTLLKEDLVDDLLLKIFPLTLGTGKRLFAEGTIPAAFKLLKTEVSPNGVVFANFERNGEIKKGSFAFEEPSSAELGRREKLAAEEMAGALT